MPTFPFRLTEEAEAPHYSQRRARVLACFEGAQAQLDMALTDMRHAPGDYSHIAREVQRALTSIEYATRKARADL